MVVSVKAISIGCAVPRLGFTGVVHSAFHCAVNLQRSGDSMLLTVLSSGEADLPQGIRLDTPRGYTFERIPVGTRTTCQDGILTLGRILKGDLREGHSWECDLSSMDADMTSPEVAAAWRNAWHALRERRVRLGSVMITGDDLDNMSTYDSVAAQLMNRILGRIRRATTAYEAAGMTEVGALVGLGPGLTPSGDDLLTGYLAGLWCAVRRRPERQRFLEAVAELVDRYSLRTNDIARTYLRLAARGQVSSRLVDLTTVICLGEGCASVLAAAEAAMRVGHSSGMETVNGLLLGMAAWDGQYLLGWGTGRQ
jgi:hypothetical protein